MSSNKRFEWDDAKAAANVAKHGIRFEIAADVFLDPALLDFDASRDTDREVRRKALGLVEGRLITIVYTMRGDMVRVVSARRANVKERRTYASVHP